MNITPYFPISLGARRSALSAFHDRLIPALVCIYLLFILPLYIDNNAGAGLFMPQNLQAWIVMVLCSLIALINVVRTGRILTGRFMVVAIFAVMLMLLPWLWTSCSLWQQHATPRLAGIVGALLFALALCQVRLTSTLRRGVLVVVVLSTLIQAAEAMMQAWLPETSLLLMDFSGTSPYGIFQQRNLLASWLATGGGLSLYLALTAQSRKRALGWAITLYPLCTALVLTQSRIGVLGLLTTGLLVILSDLSRLRHRPHYILRRMLFLISLLMWCAGISLFAMPNGKPADLRHEASTEQRVRILKGTVELIKQHPFAGNGLGSFESQFPPALAAAGLTSLENDTFTHPHNEIMYVMAEGGVSALTGLLLIGALWLWPLVFHLRRQITFTGSPYNDRWLRIREQLSAGSWLLPLSGLPVVMHMMTEYPLYQSGPHMMLLLLLFWTGLPNTTLRLVRVGRVLRACLIPFAMLLLATLVVLFAGVRTQSELTIAEEEMNHGLLPVLPAADWKSVTQAERLDRDTHLLAANTPGFLQQPSAMAVFTVWGNNWLSVHNDADVSAAMSFIARRRGDIDSAERFRAQAAKIFVGDERFTPGVE